MTSEGRLPGADDKNEEDEPRGRETGSSDEEPRAVEPPERLEGSVGSIGSDQPDRSDLSNLSDGSDMSDGSDHPDSEAPSFDDIGKPSPEDPLAWHPRLREAIDLLAAYSSSDLKEALVSMNFVSEADLLEAFATEFHMERVDWNQVAVTPDLLAQIPEVIAWKHHVFPVRYDETTLWVALIDPLNPAALEEIQEQVRKTVIGMIAGEGEILRMLGMHYG